MGHKSKNFNHQTPIKDQIFVNQNFHIFDLQDNKADDSYSKSLLQHSLINSSREYINLPDSKSIQSHRNSKEKLMIGSSLPIKYYKFQDQKQDKVQLFSKDVLGSNLQKSPKNQKIEKEQQQEIKFQSCYLRNMMPLNSPAIFYKRMKNCKVVRANTPANLEEGSKELQNRSNMQIPILVFDSSNSQSPQKMQNVYNEQQSFRQCLYQQLGFLKEQKEDFQDVIIKNNEILESEKQGIENQDQKYHQHQIFQEVSSQIQFKQLQSTTSAISTTEKSQRTKSANNSYRKQRNINDDGDQLFQNLLVINNQKNNNNSDDNQLQNIQQYQNKTFFQDKLIQQTNYLINEQHNFSQKYQQAQQPTQLSPFQHIQKQKKNQILQRIQNTKKLQQIRYSPQKYQIQAHSDYKKEKVNSDSKKEQFLSENKNDQLNSISNENKTDINSSFQNSYYKNHQIQVQQEQKESQEEIKLNLNKIKNELTSSSSEEEEISPLNVLNQRHLLTPKSVQKNNQIQLFKQKQDNILIYLEDIRKQQDQQLQLIEQSLTERKNENINKSNQILNFNSFLNLSESHVQQINSDKIKNNLQNHYMLQEQNLNEQKNSSTTDQINKNIRKNSLLSFFRGQISQTTPQRNKGSALNQYENLNENMFKSNYYEFVEQCDLKNQFQNIQNSIYILKNEEFDGNTSKVNTIHSNGNNDYSHSLTRKYDTQFERQIVRQQKTNQKIQRIEASNQSSIEKLDTRIYFSSTANSPTRAKNQSALSQLECIKDEPKRSRIIHSSYDKSRSDVVSQKVCNEVEKNIANIKSRINRINPFLIAKAKEEIPGFISELKQKEFDMENIQGLQTERKDRMYSARLRSANQKKQSSSDMKSKQQTKETGKNCIVVIKDRQSYYNQKSASTCSSPSQKYVWNKLVESKPVEMNLELWNMITRFLSVADLSFTRQVSKSWNKYALNVIQERHRNQLLIDTQKSEEIKKKYDIQMIYKVLNSKTQDIYQLFGPMCSFSIQQLQQPLFLSFQPPCLKITLECFRLFLYQNKIYTFNNILFQQKQKKINHHNLSGESLGLQNMINQIEKKSNRINDNTCSNYSGKIFNSSNSGLLNTNIATNAIQVYEDNSRMQAMRKRYYSKLFLGENMNKLSILHDAVNQKKDLLWFICTFDYNQFEKIQRLLKQNSKIMYSKQILTQYGEVVFKITDLLLGIVALYKKLQQHYPHIIQYVDSIRYYYTIHYQIGDKINKQI
ncbi:F-box protein (macronuclear) [Tetrahymena thermophila SB210]|uniref:F-box protein n=1 Tax=Tetrahymena thermophila (strain SB210) TaxID=312017 RepID=Q245U9_TETTS|nr:F-box protein [Tetrahymena thermophila SB210]EAS03534.2 F-box protein [Tetrahymena thermophila SB210]|eukprot:XP_001023779.2 F-box protein [Tetrahymena thermophila SB210]